MDKRLIVQRLLRNTAPLCFTPSGDLVCYCPGRIFLINNGCVHNKIPLFQSAKTSILNRFTLLGRLLRTGIRTAIALNDDNIVLSYGSHLYDFNLKTGLLSKGFDCGSGIRPLIFTIVKDVKSFDEGIYFGGYLGNDSKRPVNVYRRAGVDKWDVVYTFLDGMINHVHNIVPDPYRKCLWVFTGDFDEASAIWKVTDNFKKVERILCNDQKYRACVVYALPEGLLYATDAPFADDYIYLMDTETYEVKELFPIDGSCIYGCKWKDKYVFSSTVEGDGRNMSRIKWLFTRKRGAGIKDNYVHMYVGNSQEGFKEIYKEKKDCMPFYTFQFGVFKFPYGVNNSDTLFFQPVATKKNDQCLMAIKENH